jgi:four helix bundle protein
MQDHRKLDVWARAQAHCLVVRRATRAFPRTGYAALQSQTTKAAESVLFNIIEGCGTRTPKDFAKFLDSSIKSSKELEGQLELAREYGVLSRRECTALTQETIEIRRMTCGLRAKVLRKAPPPD